MEIANKPVISWAIAGLYALMNIFIATMIVFFIHQRFSIPSPALLLASVVLVLGEAIGISILISLYKTRYILTDEDLVIKTTRLIALKKEKRIPITEIKSINRTLIPFGFRLFGASFYGGYYYVPGLGRAFLTITNFKDGVLIKTEKGNYVITPRNPEEFVHVVRGRLKELRAR